MILFIDPRDWLANKNEYVRANPLYVPTIYRRIINSGFMKLVCRL